MVTNQLQALFSSEKMTMLERYLKLFEGDKELETPVRVVYAEYVAFCIEAIKYLNHSSISRFGKAS